MNHSERKAFEEMMESLKKRQQILVEKVIELRKYFASLSIQEIKIKMREYDNDILETICNTLNAIENENYEICQAAQEVLEERQKR